MKKLILASNNKHKIKEFNEVLTDYEILSLNDIGFTEDIIEDGETFADNALIKCRAVSDYCKKNNYNYDIISDDSGLCCEALNGEPGIHSARYAGNHNDQANRDKLRKELKDKNRDAYFVCEEDKGRAFVEGATDEQINKSKSKLGQYFYKVMSEILPFFEGRSYGEIIDEERGSTEFGYDSIFYSTELNKTFGEASSDEKNSVSHRGRAIEKLNEVL